MPKPKRKRIYSPVDRGRKGGMAGKGEAKSRPSSVARAAVKVRWDRERALAKKHQTPITLTTGRLC